MWDLQTPFLELVVRATAIFAFVFVVMRVWGKKHFSELSPFDFVLLLIISEAVQNALIGEDKSVTGGMVTVATMCVLNVILNKVSFHSRKAEEVLDGKPKVLVKDGVINWQVMKEETVTYQELEASLRQQGVMKLQDIGLVVMETNGGVSVVKKEDVDYSNIPH